MIYGCLSPFGLLLFQLFRLRSAGLNSFKDWSHAVRRACREKLYEASERQSFGQLPDTGWGG